jgi:hypothetical protein
MGFLVQDIESNGGAISPCGRFKASPIADHLLLPKAVLNPPPFREDLFKRRAFLNEKGQSDGRIVSAAKPSRHWANLSRSRPDMPTGRCRFGQSLPNWMNLALGR